MALASSVLASPAFAREKAWYIEVDGGAVKVRDFKYDIGNTTDDRATDTAGANKVQTVDLLRIDHVEQFRSGLGNPCAEQAIDDLALGLESDHVYADAAALAKKHPEYFADSHEARAYIEYVFSRPSHVMPGNEEDHRLVVREGEENDHKAAALEIEKRGGKYRVKSAHTLTDIQFAQRLKKFAGQVVKLGISRVNPQNRETPSRRLSTPRDVPPAIPKSTPQPPEVKG